MNLDWIAPAVTVASAGGAGYLFGAWRAASLKNALASQIMRYERIGGELFKARREIAERINLEREFVALETELAAVKTENAALTAFRAEVVAKRKITAQAGGKARAAQQAEARKGAVARTIAEFAPAAMRSRAQVVAPVKAARTRKRNQDQAPGVAASQGG